MQRTDVCLKKTTNKPYSVEPNKCNSKVKTQQNPNDQYKQNELKLLQFSLKVRAENEKWKMKIN